MRILIVDDSAKRRGLKPRVWSNCRPSPTLAIASATLLEQGSCRARLDQLANAISAAGLTSPALMIIGEVARAAETVLVTRAGRMSVAA